MKGNDFMASPLVYIIILNYASLEDTLLCVKSVHDTDYSNYKLLVIDNASPDNSAAVLKKQTPKNEFVALTKNTGYAGGNNFGLQIALEQKASYILILNPDVRLPKDSISKYVKTMQDNKNISALNPIQLTENKEKIDPIFEHEMFCRNNHAKPTLPLVHSQLWEVNTLFGAALFLDSHIVQKTGVFDPLFFAYWEEVDLCRRIKMHGGQLAVTSNAPVLHLRSYKKQGHDPFRAYLRLKGMYLFRLKNTKRSFSKLVPEILKELFRNVLLPEKNDFGWRRKEYIKTLAWILIHLPQIYTHRSKDLIGAAYI